MEYEELLPLAEEKAKKFATMNPNCHVVFGKDSIKWSDEFTSSRVLVIAPWYTEEKIFRDLGRKFSSDCYKM